MRVSKLLGDDIEKYTNLTGEDGWHVPIIKVGAYLDGYNKGLDVLDKIRDEFINRYPKNYAGEPELGGCTRAFSLNRVLQIIDKYKAESEEV